MIALLSYTIPRLKSKLKVKAKLNVPERIQVWMDGLGGPMIMLLLSGLSIAIVVWILVRLQERPKSVVEFIAGSIFSGCFYATLVALGIVAEQRQARRGSDDAARTE
jgi:hypothetical protein